MAAQQDEREVGREVDEASLFRTALPGRLAKPRSAESDEAAERADSSRKGHSAPRVRTSRAIPLLATLLRTELDRGIAFLLAPAMLAIGAFGYFALSTEPQALALAGALGIAAAGAWLARDREPARLTMAALLLVFVGAAAAKFEVARADTKVLGAAITTRVIARVVSLDQMANGRTRLTLDLLSTERPRLRYAPDRIRASARKVPPGLGAGTVVSGLVRLMPPSGPVRPHSYDFSFASYFDGVGASGFFMKGPDVVSTPEGVSLATFVERTRQAIAARVRQQIAGPEGEIAAALLVGVRAGIPNGINEALRRAGLYHIISISGLHMALVAATVMSGLRVGLALFPGFASRYAVKKFAAAAALVALTFYLLISGAEVAAERSYIMLSVMLIAVLFDRAALTMRNLAISAFLVIAVSPHEVVGPSFQMSFAATAALVGAYQAWADRPAVPRAGRPASGRRRLGRQAAGLVVGLLATSLIAGLATAVFGAWHFQRVSPLGLFSNLVVMPVVSVLVIPFSVAAALLMPFGFEGPFLWVMGRGISVMIALAGWFSAHSPVDAIGLIPGVSVLLITSALVVATLTTTSLRLAAIPFALFGIVTLGGARSPDVLISEDARLVAVDLGDGRLAVNRTRPNGFTIEDWQRALAAGGMVKPATADAQPASALSVPLSGASAAAFMPTRGDHAEPFSCAGKLCTARHASGAVIVHAQDAASAKPACLHAALIVVEDATARNVCGRAAARVITQRDLARFGSAAVSFTRPSAISPIRAEVEFSLARPYRPWHAHRAFSREARGMAPYWRAKPPARSAGGAATPAQQGTGRADFDQLAPSAQ